MGAGRARDIDRGIERAALALAAAAPLAATAPIAALEELTAAPLLRAEEGMSDARGLAWGAAAALRGAGAASAGLATFERVVLPAEQSVGEYPLTLAFLRLLESLLWAGAGARSAMTPMLQHALNEILVQHGSWRFRRQRRPLGDPRRGVTRAHRCARAQARPGECRTPRRRRRFHRRGRRRRGRGARISRARRLRVARHALGEFWARGGDGSGEGRRRGDIMCDSLARSSLT